MKVYSDIITRYTVGQAVLSVEGVFFQDTRNRDGWYEPIREFTPRREAYGFEFFLSGSSPYRSQHDREEYAATWTQWGEVIAALYSVDPGARIGHYRNREDFLTQTAAYGKTQDETPWLNAA